MVQAVIPLFLEGESGGSGITTAITTMATTIASDATAMLAAIVPTLAPIVGAVILAGLGYKFVKRFSS